MSIDLHRKSVLVTGGTGFLGRAVVRRLEHEGVRRIAAPGRRECDLVERSAVRNLLARLRPEVVIHLAAVVGGIGANRRHPGRFFFENLLMGLHLMEESRRHGVEKFVAVGTVCSYPKITPVPFREEHLWDGYPEETNAPYGLAKKMLLVQAQAYRQEYDFNGIYLVPVNLYGPTQDADPATSHVIPALIRRFLEAKHARRARVEVWGTGNASREFLYVDDAAEAVVLATSRYDAPEPVNVGVGAEITIRDLAEKIRRLVGFEGDVVWDATQPDGQPRRCIDTSRAAALFGFRARTAFDDGLRTTVEWYREHLTPAAARRVPGVGG